MDFFGIGPLELLVILIMALLVFGPRKLPEIGNALGRGIRQLRKASSDLGRELTQDVKGDDEKGATSGEDKGSGKG